MFFEESLVFYLTAKSIRRMMTLVPRGSRDSEPGRKKRIRNIDPWRGDE